MATHLAAAASGTGTGKNLPEAMLYRVYVTWYGAGTISAGQVILETALSEGYTGTWAVLDTFNYLSASGVVTGYYYGPLAAVRARIATPVSGGTVAVELIPLGEE